MYIEFSYSNNLFFCGEFLLDWWVIEKAAFRVLVMIYVLIWTLVTQMLSVCKHLLSSITEYVHFSLWILYFNNNFKVKPFHVLAMVLILKLRCRVVKQQTKVKKIKWAQKCFELMPSSISRITPSTIRLNSVLFSLFAGNDLQSPKGLTQHHVLCIKKVIP